MMAGATPDAASWVPMVCRITLKLTLLQTASTAFWMGVRYTCRQAMLSLMAPELEISSSLGAPE